MVTAVLISRKIYNSESANNAYIHFEVIMQPDHSILPEPTLLYYMEAQP